MFHRVLPKAEINFPNAYWDRGTLITSEFFSSLLIRILDSGKKLFTLKELFERHKNGLDSKSDLALTFDDGYEDNFRIVFPILKEYKVAASFYPVVSAVEMQQNLLLDDYYTAVDGLNLARKKRTDAIIGRQKDKFLDSSDAVKRKIIDELASRRTKRGKMECLYANPADLIIMYGSGMEIGGHTMSHPRLRSLSASDRERELSENMAWLKKHFDSDGFSFCYPDGNYDRDVIKSVQSAGFICAATTRTKGNIPWEIPREFVTMNYNSAQLG